jgi:ketosteroid isomerase-like protein
MKHRFLAFAALGIGLLLAVATKAEGIRTAMEAANTQFDEIYNKGDAKAVAALYTPDAQVLSRARSRTALRKSASFGMT